MNGAPGARPSARSLVPTDQHPRFDPYRERSPSPPTDGPDHDQVSASSYSSAGSRSLKSATRARVSDCCSPMRGGVSVELPATLGVDDLRARLRAVRGLPQSHTNAGARPLPAPLSTLGDSQASLCTKRERGRDRATRVARAFWLLRGDASHVAGWRRRVAALVILPECARAPMARPELGRAVALRVGQRPGCPVVGSR
jgi:hypothetical protein